MNFPHFGGSFGGLFLLLLLLRAKQFDHLVQVSKRKLAYVRSVKETQFDDFCCPLYNVSRKVVCVFIVYVCITDYRCKLAFC